MSEMEPNVEPFKAYRAVYDHSTNKHLLVLSFSHH